MPNVDAEGLNEHLAEIAKAVTPGAHAVLILDGAGWHKSEDLAIPDNGPSLKLLQYTPELDPVETVRQFLCRDKLAHRPYDTDDVITCYLCDVWNLLTAMPLENQVYRTSRRGIGQTCHEKPAVCSSLLPSDPRYGVDTAIRRTRVAKALVCSVRLGAIEMRDVTALVAGRGQPGRTPLGMSVLSRRSGGPDRRTPAVAVAMRGRRAGWRRNASGISL